MEMYGKLEMAPDQYVRTQSNTYCRLHMTKHGCIDNGWFHCACTGRSDTCLKTLLYNETCTVETTHKPT